MLLPLVHTYLPHRAVLRVQGRGALTLIHNLFTNEVRNMVKPSGPRSQYGGFLNNNGRVLFDAIVALDLEPPPAGNNEPGSSVFLEVDRRTRELAVEHLQEFNLDDGITIHDVSSDLGVVAACSTLEKDNPQYFPDPRTILGISRGYLPKTCAQTDGGTSQPEVYEAVLMHKGVGEGEDVFVSGKTLPFEANLDLLGGVSFHKGCYLGQELTHRAHVMLVQRKRLVPVWVGNSDDIDPSFGTAVWGEDKALTLADGDPNANPGNVVQTVNNFGLALMRLKYFSAGEPTLKVRLSSGAKATAMIPPWWPSDTLEKATKQ